jgi:hypothetical protein
MKRLIYCAWTGNNEMSHDRQECLEYLEHFSDCEIQCIYKDDVASFMVEGQPLHPAYQYLSDTQKADYLRTYLMNFHGGAYCDIKRPSGSWLRAFDDLERSDAWMNGYPEVEGGSVCEPWQDLIGNGGYICKPHTPLTEEWYSAVVAFLDTRLERLKKHPASDPQDCAEKSSYPIEWNELGGRIFHRVAYKYKEKLLRTVPMPICRGYR